MHQYLGQSRQEFQKHLYRHPAFALRSGLANPPAGVRKGDACVPGSHASLLQGARTRSAPHESATNAIEIGSFVLSAFNSFHLRAKYICVVFRQEASHFMAAFLNWHAVNADHATTSHRDSYIYPSFSRPLLRT